jgi:hypothetical protein
MCYLLISNNEKLRNSKLVLACNIFFIWLCFLSSHILLFVHMYGLFTFSFPGLKTETGKLSVAVLCLCSSRVDAIKNRLVTKYSRHDRINLEVNTLNDANEDWYDIVILSSVFDAKSELPQGNRINTALTKSRHVMLRTRFVGLFSYLCATNHVN